MLFGFIIQHRRNPEDDLFHFQNETRFPLDLRGLRGAELTNSAGVRYLLSSDPFDSGPPIRLAALILSCRTPIARRT